MVRRLAWGPPGTAEGTAAISATKVVTDETFESEVLQNPRPVIVEYWAQWRGPCRQVAPVLESVAGARRPARRGQAEHRQGPEDRAAVQVLAVPTLAVFSGGQVVKRVLGGRSKSAPLRGFADFL